MSFWMDRPALVELHDEICQALDHDDEADGDSRFEVGRNGVTVQTEFRRDGVEDDE